MCDRSDGFGDAFRKVNGAVWGKVKRVDVARGGARGLM